MIWGSQEQYPANPIGILGILGLVFTICQRDCSIKHIGIFLVVSFRGAEVQLLC